MNLLVSLLIVTALPDAPMQARNPDAVEVFHCGFEEAWDEDFDTWPDHWIRQRGPEFPRYLPIKITDEAAAEGEYSLRMQLDGGAAAISSPHIDVGALFSYVLEISLKTEGLVHDRVYFSLTFYDAKGTVLEETRSPLYRDVPDWQKISIGPITPVNERTRTVVIGLHLGPTDQADLKGAAQIDDIWLGRLPRMTVTLNNPVHVYTDPRDIEITCNVSGIFERDPMISFELVDVFSRRVAQQDQQLIGEVVAQKSSRVSVLSGDTGRGMEDFMGATQWRPTVGEPGYYRVRVTMQGKKGLILERQVSLVLIEPHSNPPRGEFGWSVPRASAQLPLPVLAQLLGNVGINWAKYPIWHSEKEMGRLDQLVAFAEKLSTQHIESVGLLCNPPAELLTHLGNDRELLAADIFSTSPDTWYPSLEPVLTRLSLQVHWWQLGRDRDMSLVGYPNLLQTVSTVKKQMERFGQQVHLGVNWRTLNELPPDKQAPWEFLMLTADPPLTQDELRTYLPARRIRKPLRWVELEPLGRSEYSLETRASDLIHRMLAAKMQNADAVFVPDPFDAEHGLMNEDNTPGELLLPWRTTALALAGAEYLGSLTLPKGSTNHVFARDGEVVMVVWNQTPQQEKIFLGENVRQTSVWGRSFAPKMEQHEHVLEVGPLPTFITGINEAIVRWHQSFVFEQTLLPSVFGVPHENVLIVKNYFPQGVSGQMRVNTPDVWKTYPRLVNFKMAAGEELQQPFTITLPFDATSGSQTVKVDIDVSADRHYQFSIYRQIAVGLGTVKIDLLTRLNDHGELEVEQRFNNASDEEVNFKCMLFAPDRRRLVTQVVRLGHDTDVKNYRLPNGKELIGKTLWLRAEEIGGQRILNYRFTAED